MSNLETPKIYGIYVQYKDGSHNGYWLQEKTHSHKNAETLAQAFRMGYPLKTYEVRETGGEADY